MPRLKPNTVIPTDAEDMEITRQAKEDGTYHSDKELSEFKPASRFAKLDPIIKPLGRPKAEITKTAISIRLSPDVVEYFKSTGKGWQTRLDNVLKDYVKSHHNQNENNGLDSLTH